MIEFLSYRKPLKRMVWPKHPPVLTQEQITAREKYMMLWHQELPNKYQMIEKFNHGFIASLPIKSGICTLEIGAGLGSHLPYENLAKQSYVCLEYRGDFCQKIQTDYPDVEVRCGSIEEGTSWPSGSFDRIIAIHVLEHLRDLPNALVEMDRLLSRSGFLDIVIPCEGGLAHTLARKISAERLFKKHFQMDFTPIHLTEHVNSFGEIHQLLNKRFTFENKKFFPLHVPIANMNLCVGMRLKKCRMPADSDEPSF